jgi:hypothetical protein
MAAGGLFALWATGFIASEPDVDINGQPVMYVDCRSRPGQSGSPVLAYRWGGTAHMRDGSIAVITGEFSRFIVRIAVLGFDIFLPRSFEALDDRPGTAWGEPDYIVADIKRAKDFYRADVVITYPHWGWEGEKTASQNQVQLAHLMIDSGADAVVGGHPHVTQNIENYKDKPIFYSLGNFIFDGFDTVDTTTGWALEIMINPDSKITWQIHEAKLSKNGIPGNYGVILRSD